MKRSGFIIGLMALLVAFGLYLGFGPFGQTATPAPATEQSGQSGEVSYQGVEGKTALELLKAKHTVQTKTYEGLGEAVEAIDGKVQGDGAYWIYYVNGIQGNVAAGSYVTKSTEIITWRLEKS